MLVSPPLPSPSLGCPILGCASNLSSSSPKKSSKLKVRSHGVIDNVLPARFCAAIASKSSPVESPNDLNRFLSLCLLDTKLRLGEIQGT